jgi:hypothetical protein
MVRGTAAAAVCALVLSVAACSALVDFKGLAGSPQAEGGVDAGDAGADARVADGAVGADDGGDAGPFVCPANAFCDDFDTPPLGATWSSTTLNGAASMALFDGGSQSPPYSLQVALALQTPGPQRQAELEKNLPSPGSSVKCSVSVRIDTAPPTGDATLITIRPTSQEVKKHEMYVTFGASTGYNNEDFKFADGGGGSNNGMFPAFPAQRWFRLTFATDYATADVLVDGVKVSSMQLGPSFTPTSLQVGVGERYDSERGPSLVLFDDFECVVTP